MNHWEKGEASVNHPLNRGALYLFPFTRSKIRRFTSKIFFASKSFFLKLFARNYQKIIINAVKYFKLDGFIKSIFYNINNCVPQKTLVMS